MMAIYSTLAWLLFEWLAVTLISTKPWSLTRKLAIWAAAATVYSAASMVAVYGAGPMAIIPVLLLPFRWIWYGIAWLAVTRISRTGWKPGYQIATWVCADLGLNMLLRSAFGGVYPDGLIIAFGVSGCVAGRAFEAEINDWMRSPGQAAPVVAIGITALAMAIYGAYGTILGLGWGAHAWLAVGIVGSVSIPGGRGWQMIQQEFI